MLIALAGFVAVRYAVTKWVRPHLAATLHTLVPIGRGAPLSFGGSPSGATVQVGVRGAARPRVGPLESDRRRVGPGSDPGLPEPCLPVQPEHRHHEHPGVHGVVDIALS